MVRRRGCRTRWPGAPGSSPATCSPSTRRPLSSPRTRRSRTRRAWTRSPPAPGSRTTSAWRRSRPATRAPSPSTPRAWWRWSCSAAAGHSSCAARSTAARARRCSTAPCAAWSRRPRATARSRARARSWAAGCSRAVRSGSPRRCSLHEGRRRTHLRWVPAHGARAARQRAHVQGLGAGSGAAHAHEQPRSRGGGAPRRPGRLRRHREGGAELGGVRPAGERAARARGRRDAVGPEREAGGRVPHPRRRAARADRQLEPGAPLGDVGALLGAGEARAHDVRADDRGLVDLHRLAGHRAGHVRDPGRVRRPPLRRLARRLVLTAGLGGMGGAQPLAVTMNGGVCLVLEVDPARAERRVASGYADKVTRSLDEALAWVREATAAKRPLSVGLIANAAEAIPELLKRGIVPDVATDQTSAHDPLNGYVPLGMTLEQVAEARRTRPDDVVRRARESMATHVRALLALRERGTVLFDYGNNLRGEAAKGGLAEAQAFSYPGFVPEYIRPLFCVGKGPFRWAALSGDPDDIRE